MKTRQLTVRSGLMMAVLPPILVFLVNLENIAKTELLRRQPVVQAQAEQSFTLKLGQSAQLDSMTITFSRVVQDSRCPSDVVCVWAGDAAVELIVASTEPERAAYTLHTTLKPKAAAIDGHVMRLVKVTPHPKSTVPIEPRDYSVTLTVSKDSSPPDDDSADDTDSADE